MDLDWELDDISCVCGGGGWAECNNSNQCTKNWHECPIHYEGQIHPDTRSLLLDEPHRLQEEERRSFLLFKINKSKSIVVELQKQVKLEQETIVNLELELINKTPTVRALPIFQPEIDDFSFSDEDRI